MDIIRHRIPDPRFFCCNIPDYIMDTPVGDLGSTYRFFASHRRSELFGVRRVVRGILCRLMCRTGVHKVPARTPKRLTRMDPRSVLNTLVQRCNFRDAAVRIPDVMAGMRGNANDRRAIP